MSQIKIEPLSTTSIETLRKASISIMGELKLDEQAITNIWDCIATEQERLCDLEAEQQ